MNRITRIMFVVVSLLVLEQAALAQSNCKRAKGNLVEVFNGATNSSTGTLSDGGWLNGTTVKVYNSPAYPTPDPAEVTFTSTFTLTTHQGQLKGNVNHIFDFVTGQGASIVKIDPTTSTGIFAGATGVLFGDLIKSATIAIGPYYEIVGGQVCFAQRDLD